MISITLTILLCFVVFWIGFILSSVLKVNERKVNREVDIYHTLRNIDNHGKREDR